MAMIFTDKTIDFDGTSSPITTSRSGVQYFTYSGTTGAAWLSIYAKNETTSYAPYKSYGSPGIYCLDMPSGMVWYAKLELADAVTNVSLSVV